MKETKIAAFTTIGVVLLISFFQIGSVDKFDITGGLGMSTFLLGIVAITVGIILSIIPATSKYGQGVLIGGGILLLIGISCCTGVFGLLK